MSDRFTTKQQETFYDSAVQKLVSLLSQRLLQIYKPESDCVFEQEAKWAKHIRKLTKAILFMEQQSQLVNKIADVLPLNQLSAHLKTFFVSFVIIVGLQRYSKLVLTRQLLSNLECFLSA